MSPARAKAVRRPRPARAKASAPARGPLGAAAARKALAHAQSIVPVMVSHIQLWDVERLRLLDRNPRTHTDEQVAEIASSMREFGFLWPILVNVESGTVVAGNGRLMAALRLGLRAVPVVEERHLTPVQRRAFIIADNKIALNAGWAAEILAEELPALEALGFDVSLTGFSEKEIAEIVASVEPEPPEEPDLPAPPEIPFSRPGDLWILGPHRLLCGDATSSADLQRLLDGKPAEACWTDPPYNVAYEGAAGSIQNDALSDEQFAAFLGSAFRAMIGVMRAGAPVYIAHSDTGGFTFRRAFIEAGFKLSSCLIWKKNALVLSRGDYHWQHEPILYGWKPGASHRWYGGRDKTTIAEFDGAPFQQVGEQEWQIAVGDTTLIVRGRDLTIEPAYGTVFSEPKPTASADHPTMKPVRLISRMLANSARRGAAVLDPFAGSGSTLMACQHLGLAGRMLEIDPRFVDVIVWRWQQASGEEAVREDGVRFGGKRSR